MPLDITVPTANGMVDERNRLWLVKNRHSTQNGRNRDSERNGLALGGVDLSRDELCEPVHQWERIAAD